MIIEEYLKKLELTDNEIKVFLTLFRLGVQPASVIARHLQMERTTVYKMLVRLNKMNLVSLSKKRGIQMFFIQDLNVVKNYVAAKEKEFQDLENNFEIFANEVNREYGGIDLTLPKITLYDGLDKMSNLFMDILKEIDTTGYKFLRMFASNTQSEQLSSVKIKDIAEKFFHNIKKKKVVLDSFIADGSLTMERISKFFDIDDILNLPASQSAINIYVVGSAIYLVIFKDDPTGIKIQNSDLAQSFHFLFDKLKVEK